MEAVKRALEQDKAKKHVAYYMGFTNLPAAAVIRSVQLFGEQILPRLREAAAIQI